VTVYLIWLISLLSILLMLLRPRGITEAYWACGGALLLVLFGLLPLTQAGQAIAKGFDVYLFLIGMMILSELAPLRHRIACHHLVVDRSSPRKDGNHLLAIP
jgi:Na+/H+ antiporter NhaD/arsenite permease-like protein